MSSLVRTTKHIVQRLVERVRLCRIRERAWPFVAAILLTTATIISLVRHDAIATTLSSLTQDQGSKAVSQNHLIAVSDTAAPTDKLDPAKLETRLAYVSGRIETSTSLFEDCQQAGLSEPLTRELVKIFGWDIDFARDIQRGNTFAVIHEEKYWLGQKVADGPILVAEFVNRGEKHQAVGFRDANGVTTYYESNGSTKRQLFLRTPIEFSRISSRYTDTASRFHPILKIWTAHRGVDYAAPAGTPIRATARGRITAIGWNGGYGNSIVIKHDDGPYSTLYAHLSRYAYNPSNPKTQEFREGSPVEQGQIIGYVGKTGLATGPHLHYEFRVHGEHRDPLKLKFPSTGTIPEAQRNMFLTQAQSLLAQLDLITDRRLAANP